MKKSTFEAIVGVLKNEHPDCKAMPSDVDDEVVVYCNGRRYDIQFVRFKSESVKELMERFSDVFGGLRSVFEEGDINMNNVKTYKEWFRALKLDTSVWTSFCVSDLANDYAKYYHEAMSKQAEPVRSALRLVCDGYFCVDLTDIYGKDDEKLKIRKQHSIVDFLNVYSSGDFDEFLKELDGATKIKENTK